MKLNGLRVDGFGVWSGQQWDDLGEGLNVFYGPNEAGKTTLLQFVRATLYGYSPERRRRYLPPLGGGAAGGWLDVTNSQGDFRIHRRPTGSAIDDPDRVTIKDEQGNQHGAKRLKSVLGDIDESVFTNVFAIGLTEIQQLGALDDTRAARLLYDLTTGLDRVSLSEVTRELRSSRRQLLDDGGRPAVVSKLVEQKRQLEEKVAQLAGEETRFVDLTAERDGLQQELTDIEKRMEQIEAEARLAELAEGIRERWHERVHLDSQIDALGPQHEYSIGALEQFEELNGQIATAQDRRTGLKRERLAIRESVRALGINRLLWKQGARIEALAEQRDWVTSIERQFESLEEECSQLESQVHFEKERLGLGNSDQVPVMTPQLIPSLRGPARALKKTRRAAKQFRAELGDVDVAANSSQSEEIQRTLSRLQEPDLATAIEKAGAKASKLRRRVQLGGRIREMKSDAKKLARESDYLLDRQMLPMPLIIALGLAFVVGAVLLLTGIAGWKFSALKISSPGSFFFWGLAICGTAAALKYFLERIPASQLDDCEEQIHNLERQLERDTEECDQLSLDLEEDDEEILNSRLKTAEKELAGLENLLPAQTRERLKSQEISELRRRAEVAERKYEAARDHWQAQLRLARLPESWSPGQVGQLARSHEQIQNLQRQLDRRQEEMAARLREYEGIERRVKQLTGDAGLAASEASLLQKIADLQSALDRERSEIRRRDEFREQAARLQKEQLDCARRVRAIRRQRHQLLQQVGAQSESHFRETAERFGRWKDLCDRREEVDRQIQIAVGHQFTVEELKHHFSQVDGGNGPPNGAAARQRRTQTRALRDRLLERQGELNQQLKTLADDRSLAETRLELSCIKNRLTAAAHQWQVRAVASQTLDTIRGQFERERQPEALREASAYLESLSEGRYVRVWTPLAEDQLLVDDESGNSVHTELLSRGTRELLFLALRLALIRQYADRDLRLPVILDDVLVNFDVNRAKAAARVLKEFAKEGHQVIVFTCHEHMQKIFRSLRVPVQTLPDRSVGVVQQETEYEEEDLIDEEDIIVEPDEELEEPLAEEEPVYEEEEEDVDAEYEEEEPEEEDVADEDDEYEDEEAGEGEYEEGDDEEYEEEEYEEEEEEAPYAEADEEEGELDDEVDEADDEQGEVDQYEEEDDDWEEDELSEEEDEYDEVYGDEAEAA